MRVRVATFNVHHGVGTDGVLDLERVARAVESLDADVVALQEVDVVLSARSGFVDQAAWLGARLGQEVLFGPTLEVAPRRRGAPPGRYGNALLARRPLLEWRHHALPTVARAEPRGLIEAVVDVDGTAVRVLATHLQHDSARQRAIQVDAALAVAAAGEGPLVLAGDLNSQPRDAELWPLADELVDTWGRAGIGDGLTFDAARPRMRIDYVFASPDLRVRSAAAVPTEASDHRPVVAELEL